MSQPTLNQSTPLGWKSNKAEGAWVNPNDTFIRCLGGNRLWFHSSYYYFFASVQKSETVFYQLASQLLKNRWQGIVVEEALGAERSEASESDLGHGAREASREGAVLAYFVRWVALRQVRGWGKSVLLKEKMWTDRQAAVLEKLQFGIRMGRSRRKWWGRDEALRFVWGKGTCDSKRKVTENHHHETSVLEFYHRILTLYHQIPHNGRRPHCRNCHHGTPHHGIPHHTTRAPSLTFWIALEEKRDWKPTF